MWAFGVGLSATAAFLSALAFNMQKLSLMRSRKAPFRQPLWLLAMAMRGMAALLDLVALGLAPQVLIAALGSATIVFNTFLADRIIGERVGAHHVASSLAIVVGCSLTVSFGDKETPDYAVEDLLALYSTDRMTIYAIAVVCILLVHLLLVGSISFGMRLQSIPCSLRPAPAQDKSSSFEDAAQIVATVRRGAVACLRCLCSRHAAANVVPRSPPRETNRPRPLPKQSPDLLDVAVELALEKGVERAPSPHRATLASPVESSPKLPLRLRANSAASAVTGPAFACSPASSIDPPTDALPAIHLTRSLSTPVEGEDATPSPTPTPGSALPMLRSAQSAAGVTDPDSDWRLRTPASPAPAELKDVEGYRIPTDPITSAAYMVSWCAIAGVLGGHMPLFIKCNLEIIQAAGLDAVYRVEAYVLAFAVFACASGYVHLQNILLRRYDSARVVPIISAFWVTWGSVSGVVYFDQLAGMSALAVGGLALGLVVNLGGVLAIGFAPDVSTVASLAVARNDLLDIELGEEDVVRFRRPSGTAGGPTPFLSP